MNDDALRDYYRAIQERPLPPGDQAYIPLYEDDPGDPVQKLATAIEWASLESAQLFSGFRGSGKSTELLRLQKTLGERGYQVVVCDMEDYLNLTSPVDVSDFLLALSGALGEALAKGPLKGKNVAHEDYWTRFVAWARRTKVTMDEIGVEGAGASLKASLKQDPTFRQELQKRMQGHLGALVQEVRAYVQDCVKAVEVAWPGQPLVLILDSVEHIRGTAVNADEVATALVTLFHGHGDKLRLPNLHVVYTVPPWLKIKEPGVSASFDAAVQLPCVSVADRARAPLSVGMAAMHAALVARGPWRSLVSPADADRIVSMSGGHLRDLLRLLRALLVRQRGRPWPAEAPVVTAAIEEIRRQYLPLAHSDAKWLALVARSHSTELPDGTKLPDLARYFDSLLVMTYDDGKEWWDVHPLVRETVLEQAAEATATSA